MNKGDILASYATNPNFVPIMNKASAILTEEGGLTCHASIFAREFSIPCVVGIQNLMSLVEDGDELEVDATKGIVRIVSR
ncbi:MAG: hypothetical protein KKF89_01895 [Nanoarchaeota archaeon]|nr:hypothetical protein [Nanoarchaeota archaeon]MBU1854448.1 hypothetical protein [Nanoarchaeota archaeon]